MRELRVFGLFSATKSSMPEVSKVSTWAREESMSWQMGSVKSTICRNMSSMKGSKFCRNLVKSGASGTLEKPQKSRSSLHSERKRISRESEGMEKIFCKIRAERNPAKG